MKKQTKDQIIAAQADAIENLNSVALNSLRERDDAREAMAVIHLAPGDDVQRLRLATLAFPKDDPKSIGWDDLAQYFGQRKRDDAELLKTAQDTAGQHGIDKTLSLPELIEALGEKLLEASNAHDYVEKMAHMLSVETTEAPDDAAEAVMIAVEEHQAELDNHKSLLEAFGLSTAQITRMLDSADMHLAIKQELYGKARS